jgi:hypothetical protein
MSCNISNSGKLVWSMTSGGCGSKAEKAHVSILYTPVTVHVQRCVCQ